MSGGRGWPDKIGATDIETERGDEKVARIIDLTKGIGADSVLECVGMRSMMQAIHATRPGGYVGCVRVTHGVELRGEELFSYMAGPPGAELPSNIHRFGRERQDSNLARCSTRSTKWPGPTARLTSSEPLLQP